MRASINPKELIDAARRNGTLDSLPSEVIEEGYRIGALKRPDEGTDAKPDPAKPKKPEKMKLYGLTWTWSEVDQCWYNAQEDVYFVPQTGDIIRDAPDGWGENGCGLERVTLKEPRQGAGRGTVFGLGALAGWAVTKVAEAIFGGDDEE